MFADVRGCRPRYRLFPFPGFFTLPVEVVGPLLHHTAAFIEKGRAVIGSIDLVGWYMRELAISHLVPVAKFLFDRRHRERAEAMPYHSSRYPHAFECHQNGPIAHMLAHADPVGGQPFAVADKLLLLTQSSQGLT